MKNVFISPFLTFFLSFSFLLPLSAQNINFPEMNSIKGQNNISKILNEKINISKRDNTEVNIHEEKQEVISEQVVFYNMLNAAQAASDNEDALGFYGLMENLNLLALKNYLRTASGDKNAIIEDSINILSVSLAKGMISDEDRQKMQRDLTEYFSNTKSCRGRECARLGARAIALMMTTFDFSGNISILSDSFEIPSSAKGDNSEVVSVLKASIKNNFGNLEEDLTAKLGILDALYISGNLTALEEEVSSLLASQRDICRRKYECQEYQVGVALINRLSSYGHAVLPILKKFSTLNENNTVAAWAQANINLAALYPQEINFAQTQERLEDFYCGYLPEVKNSELDFALTNETAKAYRNGLKYKIGKPVPIEVREIDNNGGKTEYYTPPYPLPYHGWKCPIVARLVPNQLKVKAEGEAKNRRGNLMVLMTALSFSDPVFMMGMSGVSTGNSIAKAVRDNRTLSEAGPEISINAAFFFLPLGPKIQQFVNIARPVKGAKEMSALYNRGKILETGDFFPHYSPIEVPLNHISPPTSLSKIYTPYSPAVKGKDVLWRGMSVSKENLMSFFQDGLLKEKTMGNSFIFHSMSSANIAHEIPNSRKIWFSERYGTAFHYAKKSHLSDRIVVVVQTRKSKIGNPQKAVTGIYTESSVASENIDAIYAFINYKNSNTWVRFRNLGKNWVCELVPKL